MDWKVVFSEKAINDLLALSTDVQKIIDKTIISKLSNDPVKFGKPLRRNLKGYMKLRVGDYRVIYSIKKNIVTVFVVKIGHRREVYEK